MTSSATGRRLCEALSLPPGTTELTLRITAQEPYLVATVTHYVPDAEGKLTDLLRTIKLVEAPEPLSDSGAQK